MHLGDVPHEAMLKRLIQLAGNRAFPSAHVEEDAVLIIGDSYHYRVGWMYGRQFDFNRIHRAGRSMSQLMMCETTRSRIQYYAAMVKAERQEREHPTPPWSPPREPRKPVKHRAKKPAAP